MAKTLTTDYPKQVNPTSGSLPVLTLDIDHSALSTTVRVVNDNDDFPYGAAHTHKTSTAYLAGDVIIPATYNGHYFVAQNDGTTSVSPPTWPVNSGGTVLDGSVTWQEVGYLYKAMGFELIPPDDLEQGLPEASLRVDNVGVELTDLIETTKGGRGATMIVREVFRTSPNTPQWSFKLKLRGVQMDARFINGKLGYDNPFNRPAVSIMFTPETAPGLV